MRLTDLQIERLRAFFKEKPVLKAWVFGSFARGEATNESDIDLLVELDYFPGFSSKYFEMMYKVEDLMGRKVDLISAKGVSPLIAPFIEKDKQLIYERLAI